jgi:ribose transport system permease protein
MSISCTLAIYLQPYGIFPAIIGGLICGTAAGFINGLIVVKSGVNSLPVTLGTMGVLNGIVYVITKSQSVPGKNLEFVNVSNASVGGLSLVVVVFVLLAIVFEILLQRGFLGRKIMAVGGNSIAASMSGLNVNKVRIQVFTLAGFLASVGGIMTAARYNIASGHIGEQTALAVITAVLIGGISLKGGSGSVTKALLGYLFIIALQNAMRLLKFPSDIHTVITGVLLIAILAVDAHAIRKNQFK